MSGRASLGLLEVGNVKLRGNIKSVDRGGVKRTPDMNADGTSDFHEELMPSKIVFEMSVIADTDEDAIRALVDQLGLLTYRTNGRKIRFPKLSFLEMGEIGPEGKCDVTFGGEPGVRAK